MSSAWQTLLAALGGFVFGLGVGLMLTQRALRRLRNTDMRHHDHMTNSLLPLLEEHAERIGIQVAPLRRKKKSDVYGLSLELSRAIASKSDSRDLSFSDTVDADVEELIARASRPPPSSSSSSD